VCDASHAWSMMRAFVLFITESFTVAAFVLVILAKLYTTEQTNNRTSVYIYSLHRIRYAIVFQLHYNNTAVFVAVDVRTANRYINSI